MRVSREWVTAEGAGRSTSVESEHLITHRCKLLERENPARERIIVTLVYEEKNHCIRCKKRGREG